MPSLAKRICLTGFVLLVCVAESAAQAAPTVEARRKALIVLWTLAIWLLRRARRIYTLQPRRNQVGKVIYLQSSSPSSSDGGLPFPPVTGGVTSIALRGGRGISTIMILFPNCSAGFGSRGA